tara:strand:- start:2820 stop:3305 length:486 start_codon:yes stop_codon:yes gene_type:complete
MQTVYILKDSNKSYRALLQLYDSAELSTNIIIVNKFYSKMLLLDKRVKSFPFIINTLPTSIGLVPKFAKVLPLELFLQIRGSSSKKNKPIKEIKNRVINYNPTYERKPRNLYTTYSTPSIPNKFHKHGNFTKQNNKLNNKVRKPLIKTVKETDGSVNIIMK